MSNRHACAAFLVCAYLLTQVTFAQDVSSERRQIGDNENQQYILLGDRATPPEDGFGLLIVLPGGDGSADFQPFVTNIHRSAAPEGFLTLQLIATPGDANIVWPTAKSPSAKQAFTTEQFIAAAVENVAGDVPVDRDRLLVFGWSSGGPAAYAAALDESLGIDGAYVAMSVFKPQQLPPLSNAKGKAFAILHSPQDRVCPVGMAVTARQRLEQHGAEVWFRGYAGGHGWQGDSFQKLQAGLAWLNDAVVATPADEVAAAPAGGEAPAAE